MHCCNRYVKEQHLLILRAKYSNYLPKFNVSILLSIQFQQIIGILLDYLIKLPQYKAKKIGKVKIRYRQTDKYVVDGKVKVVNAVNVKANDTICN